MWWDSRDGEGNGAHASDPRFAVGEREQPAGNEESAARDAAEARMYLTEGGQRAGRLPEGAGGGRDPLFQAGGYGDREASSIERSLDQSEVRQEAPLDLAKPRASYLDRKKSGQMWSMSQDEHEAGRQAVKEEREKAEADWDFRLKRSDMEAKHARKMQKKHLRKLEAEEEDSLQMKLAKKAVKKALKAERKAARKAQKQRRKDEKHGEYVEPAVEPPRQEAPRSPPSQEEASLPCPQTSQIGPRTPGHSVIVDVMLIAVVFCLIFRKMWRKRRVLSVPLQSIMNAKRMILMAAEKADMTMVSSPITASHLGTSKSEQQPLWDDSWTAEAGLVPSANLQSVASTPASNAVMSSSDDAGATDDGPRSTATPPPSSASSGSSTTVVPGVASRPGREDAKPWTPLQRRAVAGRRQVSGRASTGSSAPSSSKSLQAPILGASPSTPRYFIGADSDQDVESERRRSTDQDSQKASLGSYYIGGHSEEEPESSSDADSEALASVPVEPAEVSKPEHRMKQVMQQLIGLRLAEGLKVIDTSHEVTALGEVPCSARTLTPFSARSPRADDGGIPMTPRGAVAGRQLEGTACADEVDVSSLPGHDQQRQASAGSASSSSGGADRRDGGSVFEGADVAGDAAAHSISKRPCAPSLRRSQADGRDGGSVFEGADVPGDAAAHSISKRPCADAPHLLSRRAPPGYHRGSAKKLQVVQEDSRDSDVSDLSTTEQQELDAVKQSRASARLQQRSGDSCDDLPAGADARSLSTPGVTCSHIEAAVSAMAAVPPLRLQRTQSGPLAGATREQLAVSACPSSSEPVSSGVSSCSETEGARPCRSAHIEAVEAQTLRRPHAVADLAEDTKAMQRTPRTSCLLHQPLGECPPRVPPAPESAAALDPSGPEPRPKPAGPPRPMAAPKSTQASSRADAPSCPSASSTSPGAVSTTTGSTLVPGAKASMTPKLAPPPPPSGQPAGRPALSLKRPKPPGPAPPKRAAVAPPATPTGKSLITAKLKPLQSVEGTIFASAGSSTDEQLLESMLGDKSKQAGKRRSFSARRASKKLLVLDGRRAQNIAIALRGARVKADQVVRALRAMDCHMLDEGIAEALSPVFPTMEEASKLAEYTGERMDQLRDIEREAAMLSLVPRGAARTWLLGAALGMDATIQRAQAALRSTRLACVEIHASKHLRLVIAKILGAAQKAVSTFNAPGFTLSGLMHLIDARGASGLSILHYVALECRTEEQRFMEAMKGELKRVPRAAVAQVHTVQQQIQDLDRLSRCALAELASGRDEYYSGDGAAPRAALVGMVAKAAAAARSLRRMVQRTNRSLAACERFLGHHRPKATADELDTSAIAIVHSFLERFARSWCEVKQKAVEQKDKLAVESDSSCNTARRSLAGASSGAASSEETPVKTRCKTGGPQDAVSEPVRWGRQQSASTVEPPSEVELVGSDQDGRLPASSSGQSEATGTWSRQATPSDVPSTEAEKSEAASSRGAHGSARVHRGASSHRSAAQGAPSRELRE